MRRLFLVLLMIVTLLEAGCSSVPKGGPEPSFNFECRPFRHLEAIATNDLYQSQAPIPCLGAYRSVQQRSGQNRDVAVAIAISGGGHRAANFAMGVLLGLEEIQTETEGNNILAEADYFSTVSGGGLAAGTFISTLYDHQQNTSAGPSTYSLRVAMEDGRDNGPAHDLRTNLQRFLWLAAWRPGLGRNQVMQDRLDRIVLDSDQRKSVGGKRRSLTLGDVFIPSSSVNVPPLPYWFINATIVANGAIFPFTPDILDLYRVTGYRHTEDEEFKPYEMPIAAGMAASASFPGAIPPLTLCVGGKCGRKRIPDTPGRYELQLLDGGVSDNLGVFTALAVLKQDEAKDKILLVVDAYVGKEGPWQSAGDRLSTLNVLRRTSFVALDSWRGRYKHVVAAIANGLTEKNEHWSVIYLSFDDLKENDLSLHDKVHDVKTNLNISEDQQADLLKAGRAVVRAKSVALCRAFPCVVRH